MVNLSNSERIIILHETRGEEQLHSAIAILNSDIRHHMNASSRTMIRTSAFAIQLVRTTMTLSTVRLNNDCQSYIYEQIQNADIPKTFDQRNKWLRTFDLMMAKLMDLLRDQKVVSHLLEVEQDGAIEIHKYNTVRTRILLAFAPSIVCSRQEHLAGIRCL